MDRTGLENAVIHQDMPKSLTLKLRGPLLEDGGGGEAGFFQQLGIAKGRIAVSDQNQVIAALHQHGSELKIRPQEVQSGRSGQNLHVTGRHEQLMLIVPIQHPPLGQRLDGDANAGVVKQFIAQDRLDVFLEISPGAADEGPQQRHPEQNRA